MKKMCVLREDSFEAIFVESYTDADYSSISAVIYLFILNYGSILQGYSRYGKQNNIIPNLNSRSVGHLHIQHIKRHNSTISTALVTLIVNTESTT